MDELAVKIRDARGFKFEVSEESTYQLILQVLESPTVEEKAFVAVVNFYGGGVKLSETGACGWPRSTVLRAWYQYSPLIEGPMRIAFAPFKTPVGAECAVVRLRPWKADSVPSSLVCSRPYLLALAPPAEFAESAYREVIRDVDAL